MSIQDSQHLDPEARILSLGDTPSVQAGSNDWLNAWSKRGVTATHKANLTNALEAWSAVKYTNLLATTLLGGDIAAGALGVGGQSAATSAVRQEIDGKEALRFTLGEPASAVSISLASFFANDDGTAYAEGARVRLFDGAGAMVGQGFVFATQASGKQLVQLASNQPFVTVELSAGAQGASGAFVHGAYTDAQGAFATAIFSNASGAHGSDFLVEQVVFEFARPKAAGDAYQATEDGGVQAFSSVLANDRDAAGAALSAELQFSPEHGTLSLNADGSFTYVADPDYFGEDSFSYRAFNGKDYSDPTIVELQVRSVNDGPTAADDSATVYQGGHASLIDVLANDKAGPANEAGQVLAITAASAANGTAWVREDGQLLYVPNAGFTGTDTIRYTVTDNGLSNGVADPRSASAQASVTVVGVNGAPVARGDSAATDEDSAVSGNVLDGSNGGLDTDPDDDPLVVTSTGSFTTALGGSSTAQVAITVHGRNEAPSPVAGQGVINRSVEPGTDISYYLRYTNAAGAVQWLAVDSFAWDASAENSFTKGGGAAVGKPNPGQFDLVLGSSRATTEFLAKIMEGKHFADLVLEGIVMDRSGRPASVQEYLLKDAFVTSVRISGSADSTSIGLSLVAKEISLGIAPLDAQGRAPASAFDFAWNIPAGNLTALPVNPRVNADLDHLGQSLPVDAPLDYYVRIDGIDGWFRLSGFSMGFTAESSYLKGAGAAVGKPVPDTVTMALGSSQAITDLLAKLVKGAHGPVVEIETYARLPGAEGKQVLVEEFFFRTVFTTSVAQSDDGHNDISFVYKSFSESHIAYKADGQVDAANSGRFGYDVGSAQVIGVPDPVADLF